MTRETFGRWFAVVGSALAIIQVYLALIIANTNLIIANTIWTYDEQKTCVQSVITEFIEELQADGYHVTNDSTGVSGSGEWRDHVAITTTSPTGGVAIAYIEVMGFVSHDLTDTPNWYKILPMRISHNNLPMDHLFSRMLIQRLRQSGWEYSVDTKFVGFDGFGPSQYPQKPKRNK